MAEKSSLIGATVGGLFTIRRLIGQGGMGEVYEADAADGSKVALKILHPRMARDPDMVTRFHRESAIAAEIRSPFIAAIKGTGKHRERHLWIAFEHLVGETLEDRLRKHRYMPFEHVVPIVDDVLQGLVAAHAAGVVHRDIKPGNLFLENVPARESTGANMFQRTRILDFGISKKRRVESDAEEDAEPSLTAFDATLGSFSYMAPEQVGGSARVDERADLYALGVVAFRALTGRLPFESPNGMAMIALKLDREAPSLSMTTGNEWPEEIERFMHAMMAREKEDRFENASRALESWRAVQHNLSAPAPVPLPLATSRDTWVSDDRTEVTLASSGEFGIASPLRKDRKKL